MSIDNPEDVKTFLLLVKDMRTEQRAYFDTRNTVILQKSKRLEKAVDTAIEQMTSNEQTLF